MTVIELINALVRPVTTFGLAAAFIYLSVVGKVPVEAFLSVVSMVFGFWYMQRQGAKGEPPQGGQS